MSVIINLPFGLGDAIQALAAVKIICEVEGSLNVLIITEGSYIKLFKNVFKITANYIERASLIGKRRERIFCDLFLDFNSMNSDLGRCNLIQSKKYLSHNVFVDSLIKDGARCILIDGSPVQSRFYNAKGFKPLPAWNLYTDMIVYGGYPFNQCNYSQILLSSHKSRSIFLRKKISLGLAPCGTLNSKHWPIRNYIDLSNYYISRGIDVDIYLGPNEIKHKKNFRLNSVGARVYFNLPLQKLAYRMSNNSLIVANDSGPMHVAGALGYPLVGVFNKTLPQCWFPYTGKDQMVMGGSYYSIFTVESNISHWPSLEKVKDNINKILKIYD
jgi:ADP-heptose:LPS heptosyltransferase